MRAVLLADQEKTIWKMKRIGKKNAPVRCTAHDRTTDHPIAPCFEIESSLLRCWGIQVKVDRKENPN
jgi:hypothetical protein